MGGFCYLFTFHTAFSEANPQTGRGFLCFKLLEMLILFICLLKSTENPFVAFSWAGDCGIGRGAGHGEVDSAEI